MTAVPTLEDPPQRSMRGAGMAPSGMKPTRAVTASTSALTASRSAMARVVIESVATSIETHAVNGAGPRRVRKANRAARRASAWMVLVAINARVERPSVAAAA